MGQPAERKLVTVVFADVDEHGPGFGEADPEDPGAGLADLVRAVVERFGGSVEQVAGARTVAAFGLRGPSPDHAERAVLAAMAVRDAVAAGNGTVQLSVATGEVLAGPGGLAGEPLATCARLAALAEPGAVLVSEATGRATALAIAYGPAPAGLHALGPSGQAGRREAPLVGRERELGLLAGRLAQVVRTRTPALVTLVGPPGIGKSRLAAELAAGGHGYGWLRVAPPAGEPLGYSLSALAGPLRAWAGDGSAEAGLARLTAGLPGPAAAWVRGHLRPLLGLPWQGRGDQGEEAPTALRRLLYGLAAERPLAVVVEDLERADDALLGLVEDLVDPEATGPAGAVPLLVVGTARPELLERRPGWGGLLALGPLGQADTATLLEALLASHGLPAGIGPGLLEQVAGNPLFAEEWVRMLADRGPAADSAPPAGVHAIVAARVGALPPDELAVLRDAAVLGPVAPERAIAAVGGRDPAAGLARLEAKEFLRRSAPAELAFAHVLVREVAYGQLLRAERAAKHQAAAAWLLAQPGDRTEALAAHWRAALAAGADLGEQRGAARAALREAGARAAGLGAHATAAGAYAAAVELSPAGDPERPGLLLRLGRARCQGEGGGEDVLAAARDALMASGDPVSAAEAETLLAELAFLHGQGGERVAHLERALAMVDGAPDSPAKAAVLRGLMLHLAVASRHAEARALAGQVLAMAERLGLGELRADALGTIGLARVDGGDQGGLGDLERAIAAAGELGGGGAVLWQLNLAYARAALGDLAGAGRALDDAESAAARSASARRLRSVRLQRVAGLYWAGRWDEAVAIVDGLLAAGGRHYLEWECRTWRGRIRLARDGAEAAEEDAASALALAGDLADPQARTPTLAFRIRVLLAAGRRTEAAALAGELLASLGASLLGPEVGADLGLVLAELSVPVAELDRRGTPPSVWLAAARALAGGDPGAAAQAYERIGARPDAAQAHLAAATRLATAGRPAQARDHLRAATTFWRQVRADHQLGQAAALGLGGGAP